MSIESHRKAVFKYKQKHFQLGLCLDCSTPVTNGKNLCNAHQARENKRSLLTVALRRSIYKSSGKCPRCGTPLDPDADNGCINCINCRESRHEIIGIKRKKSKLSNYSSG